MGLICWDILPRPRVASIWQSALLPSVNQPGGFAVYRLAFKK